MKVEVSCFIGGMDIKEIEQSYLTLEEEAMRLGISRDVIEFTEDFR